MVHDDLNKEMALGAMQRVCSGRELCVTDVLRRLRKYSISQDDLSWVVESLLKDGFVDESRYAKAFVRDKVLLSGWGVKKIIWALKNKGIDKLVIDEAIKEITLSEEPVRLEAILKNKLKSYRKTDNAKQLNNKMVRFALSRGFSLDISLSVVNKLLSNFAQENE
ncbi:MAG: regulatory protein RecX [Bacteroidales bacterium]|nr:regulatory protein RecX [Bacteroidales bacterium]MDD4617992.1 regulatory protein RecX [Bacteroidales bacterium]